MDDIKFKLQPIFTISFIALITISTAQNTKVLMHYMPWYGAEEEDWRHWERHCQSLIIENPGEWLDDSTRNIASVNYPLAGPYNSLDTGLIQSHLLYMLTLQVDGLTMNWYGKDSYEDQVIKKWFEQVAAWKSVYGESAVPMEIALMVDDLPYMDPALSQAEKRALIIEDINFIDTAYYEKYSFSHKFNGKKVVYYFPKRLLSGAFNLSPTDWEIIMAAINPDITIVYHDDLVSDYGEHLKGNFVWFEETYSPSNTTLWGEGALNWYYNTVGAYLQDPSKPNFDYRVAVVYPGFNDSGVCAWTDDIENARYITRQVNGVEVFDLTWNLIYNFNANSDYDFDFVQIATFNDWNEGSEIEPSRDFGFKYMNEAMEHTFYAKGLGVPDTNDLKVGLNYYLAYKDVTNENHTDILNDYFGNLVPIADAGESGQVIIGDVISLNGGGSSDANNDPLEYSWTINSKPLGSLAELSNPNNVISEFTVDVAGEYVIVLIVNDGKESSIPATVTITAVSPAAAAEEVLLEISNEFSQLPLDVFKNQKHQERFIKRIEKVLKKINNGKIEKAQKKLTKGILEKMDGCAKNGAPDKRDKIIVCNGGQDIIYPLIQEALSYLAMIE